MVCYSHGVVEGIDRSESAEAAYKAEWCLQKIYEQFNNCPIVQSTFFFYDDVNEVVDDVCTNEMVVKLVWHISVIVSFEYKTSHLFQTLYDLILVILYKNQKCIRT